MAREEEVQGGSARFCSRSRGVRGRRGIGRRNNMPEMRGEEEKLGKGWVPCARGEICHYGGPQVRLRRFGGVDEGFAVMKN
jgi:hypothetical protein